MSLVTWTPYALVPHYTLCELLLMVQLQLKHALRVTWGALQQEGEEEAKDDEPLLLTAADDQESPQTKLQTYQGLSTHPQRGTDWEGASCT